MGTIPNIKEERGFNIGNQTLTLNKKFKKILKIYFFKKVDFTLDYGKNIS